VLWALYLTCTTYVGPGEFGIKQVLTRRSDCSSEWGLRTGSTRPAFIISSQRWRKILRFPKNDSGVDYARRSRSPAKSDGNNFSYLMKNSPESSKLLTFKLSDGFYVKMDGLILY